MASAGAIRAGRGEVEIGADLTDLQKDLNTASQKLKDWGGSVAKAGAIVGAIGASISAPFLYGLSVLESWGDETQRVMRQTGLSFEQVDLLMDGLRGNLLEPISSQQFVAGFAAMNKFIQDAREGTQSATDAMRDLGLTTQQLQGMNGSQRLEAIADGLQRITDEGRRSAVAVQVLGRRNAFAFNLTGGAAGINERSAQVEALQGSTLHSREGLRAANDVRLEYNRLKLAMEGFWASLGAAAAPVMADFYRIATKVIIAVRQWTERNKPLLTTIFYIADKLVMIGVVLGTIGGAIMGAGTAISLLSASIPVLVAGVKMFFGALILAGAAVAYVWLVYKGVMLLIDLFPKVAQAVSDAFGAVFAYFAEGYGPMLESLYAGFVDIWGGIVNAVSAGNLELAFEIAVMGLRLLWMQWINYAYGAWLDFKFMFLTVFESLFGPLRGMVANISILFAHMMTGIYNAVVDAYNALVLRMPTEVAATLGLRQVGRRFVDEEGIRQRVNNVIPDARQAGNEAQAERIRAAEQERALQEQIDAANIAAWFDAQIAEVNREIAFANLGGREAGEGGSGVGGRVTSFGTFSAENAMSSFFAAESPMTRVERLERRQVEQNEMMIRVLNEIRDRGAIRFG